MKYYYVKVVHKELGRTYLVPSSIDLNEVHKHIEFINTIDKIPPLTEIVEREVLVDVVGWYNLSNGMIVYIDKITNRDCIGSIWKVDKKRSQPHSRKMWYLDGTPTAATKLYITSKAKP